MDRVVLVESSAALPGLFPFHSWEVLTAADLVWVRDPDTHPSRDYLRLAQIPLARLEPAEVDPARGDLPPGASPGEYRRAVALLDLAAVEGQAVYLLGPGDPEGFTRTVGLSATEVGGEVEFVFHTTPPGAEMVRLVELERRLRDPEDGCPWDVEQDHASLTRHAVEEVYELVDAIDGGDDAALAEELGDVLFQVVFHAQIASERSAFDLDEVVRRLIDKLVYRHPHVFADVGVDDADEVRSRWETLKQREKGRTGPFEGIPGSLPALQLTDTFQRRAAKRGLDWRGPGEPLERAREKLTAVELATDRRSRQEELGEVLGALVGVARHLGLDAEQALRHAATAFRQRFETAVELAADRGLEVGDLGRDGWVELWREADARHGDSP